MEVEESDMRPDKRKRLLPFLLSHNLPRVFLPELVQKLRQDKEAFSEVSTFDEIRRSVDERVVSGDGFMLNLMSVLEMLSFKILLDKVDPYYPFHPKSRISISSEARFSCTSQEAEAWVDEMKKKDQPPWQAPNFSTECFYLTLHAHHLSIIPIMRKYQRRLRAIRDLNRMIEEMEGNHPQWKSQVQRLQKSKLCADAGVLDQTMLVRVLRFYTQVSQFLLRAADPKLQGSELPLQPEVPMQFSALPEYYLEDIADFLLFVLQYMPDVLADPGTGSVLQLLIVMICSQNYIRNPICLQNWYHLAIIFKSMWGIPAHQAKFIQEAE
nr:hypothetical protein BaRGS_005363 [Batillaria attramentaria]